MFDSIKGKSAMITGASTGIGAECARLLSQYGVHVGIHYRQNKEKAEKLAEEIKSNGGNAVLFHGDLLDRSVRETIIDNFVKIFGKIDLLINNAGACYSYKHFSEIDEDSWNKTISLNAKAPFFLSRHAFNYMKKYQWGRIINISTASIKFGGAKSLHYCASKAALEALTIGFAKEGAKYNILVNSIKCGVIDTSMHTSIDGYDKKRFEKRVAMIPLNRVGKPIDIAGMVVFLASDCGNFITGESFSIDGGE